MLKLLSTAVDHQSQLQPTSKMDPFALLSSGARFSKQHTGPSNKRPAPATAANFSGVAQPLPALPSDPQQQSSQQRPSKRQRRAQAAAAAAAAQQQADAAGDAGSISLFGGSSASQQQQSQQKQDNDAELLPVVNTKDPYEEANVIRKALKIKVG